MVCSHDTCGHLNSMTADYDGLRAQPLRAGVAAAILQTSFRSHMNLAVGLETAGQYRNQWNVCAGGARGIEIDRWGNVCYLKTLQRELAEEFKLLCDTWAQFDTIFKTRGQFDYFIINGTPVFIGHMPRGVHRADIRQQMAADNNNRNVSHSLQEMQDFEYCNLGTRCTPEGRSLVRTGFTNAIIHSLVAQGF